MASAMVEKATNMNQTLKEESHQWPDTLIDDDEDDEKEKGYIKHGVVDEKGQRVGHTRTSNVEVEDDDDNTDGEVNRKDDKIDKKDRDVKNDDISESKDQDTQTEKASTPKRRTFKDVMSSAMKQRRPSPAKSRSPTPFDNVERPATVKRTPSGPAGITPDLMHPQYLRTPNRDPKCKPTLTTIPPAGSRVTYKPRTWGGESAKDEDIKFEVPPTPSTTKGREGRERERHGKKERQIIDEPKNRTMMRRVVSNLKTNKNKQRWKMLLDKDKPEDPNEEYVINFLKTQENAVDTSGLQGAGKLWPGKDYVNYLVKDFVDVHEAYSDFINRYVTLKKTDPS